MGGSLAFLQVSATAHSQRARSVSVRRDEHRFLDPGSPGVGATSQVHWTPRQSLPLVVWAAWHLRAAATDRLLTMRWLSALICCSSQFRGGRRHCSHPVLDEEAGAPGGEATSGPVIRDGDTCAYKGGMSFPQEAECPVSRAAPSRGAGVGVGVRAHSAWSLGNDPGLEGQWNDDFLPRPAFRRLEAGWWLTFPPKASLARLEEGCGRWVGSG